MDVTKISVSMGTTKIVVPVPAPKETPPKRLSERDSHENDAWSYGVVYVNEVGRDSSLNWKTPRFPAGSIIVREKLATPDATVPERLVVMIKREPGFNPKANDWEFLAMDGAMSKIDRREKTGKCSDCHTQSKNTDYVFRSYLSDAIRSEQK